MDYNINVKLQVFHENKRTSSTQSINNKQHQVSTQRNIENKSIVKSGAVGGKKSISMLKKGVGVFAVAAAATKGARVVTEFIGTYSNNRLREKIMGDTISAVTNPYGFLKDVVKFQIKNHYHVLRENQRIGYYQKLSGNLLPETEKTGLFNI